MQAASMSGPLKLTLQHLSAFRLSHRNEASVGRAFGLPILADFAMRIKRFGKLHGSSSYICSLQRGKYLMSQAPTLLLQARDLFCTLLPHFGYHYIYELSSCFAFLLSHCRGMMIGRLVLDCACWKASVRIGELSVRMVVPMPIKKLGG